LKRKKGCPFIITKKKKKKKNRSKKLKRGKRALAEREPKTLLTARPGGLEGRGRDYGKSASLPVKKKGPLSPGKSKPEKKGGRKRRVNAHSRPRPFRGGDLGERV